MKSKSTKGIDKQLDDAWSLLVKLTAGNKCEYCSNTQNLNSHHVFGRRNHSVRWYPSNGVCLCAGHHALLKFSAHQSPTWFANWIIQKRGQKWYDILEVKARGQSHLSKFEKEIILKELRDEIQKYGL